MVMGKSYCRNLGAQHDADTGDDNVRVVPRPAGWARAEFLDEVVIDVHA
jgi:hypothetical protein